jgi:hypothetical protein
VTSIKSTRPDVEDSERVLAIVVAEAGGAVAELEVLSERARAYARGSKAANTLRAYESDLRHFGAWCERRALEAFPAAPETVALYLVDHAGRLAVSTLRRRLAAISEAHQAARFANPTIDAAVRTTWAGIRRAHGTAPAAKEAAVTEVVAAMVAPMGEHLIDVRDRAILLLGSPALCAGRSSRRSTSATSCRRARGSRSPWRAPRLTRRPRATRSASPMAPTRRRARSAPGARGSRLRTLKGGPAFRRLLHDRITPDRIAGDGIARMVKRRASAAGYAPELFSGHSLRAGFATTAARAGVAEHRIMRARWRTSQAMRGYIQEGELFVDNPSAKLGSKEVGRP